MNLRHAIVASLAALPFFRTQLAFADETPTPTDASLDARRANVERAEDELHLFEREQRIAARRRELESPPVAKSAAFSRAGRVVFPNLAGFSISGLNGASLGAGGVISFQSASIESGYGLTTKTTSLAFNPSADVFLGDHLTIGCALAAARSETSYSGNRASLAIPLSGSGYYLDAVPRIGWTVDLGAVTLWPKIGAGYGVSRMEMKSVSGMAAGRELGRTFGATLDVDAVFPLGRYLVFALGPTLSYEHTSRESSPGSPVSSVSEGDSILAGVRAFIGVTL